MIPAAGYQALGIAIDLPASDSTTAFTAGMAARSQDIGDVQPADAAQQWIGLFRPNANQVHLMVAIASDDPCELGRRLVDLYDEVQTSGCTVVWHERGTTLPQPLTGHEHFGFKDGISQPVLIGDDPPPAVNEPAVVQPGDFVFGYPDSLGMLRCDLSDPVIQRVCDDKTP